MLLGGAVVHVKVHHDFGEIPVLQLGLVLKSENIFNSLFDGIAPTPDEKLLKTLKTIVNMLG